MSANPHPVTLDGRYFVVRGRLWRRANPSLAEPRRAALVAELMTARRAVRTALQQADATRLAEARAAVDQAKVALGERGPVWWDDGAPDLNRHMAVNTPYAAGTRPKSKDDRRCAARIANGCLCQAGHGR